MSFVLQGLFESLESVKSEFNYTHKDIQELQRVVKKVGCVAFFSIATYLKTYPCSIHLDCRFIGSLY